MKQEQRVNVKSFDREILQYCVVGKPLELSGTSTAVAKMM